ncbi:hypothetical protein RchiOBHm_Chr2g0102641 [Rosa chinensis]|uniref:Uncharacterized protein n=1 Tax=Rosa chinensis TaxID=74649 RepID=A0A2P6RMP7_ROSCH|nr:hypothetical protein RchiOBHm_Chr2g0102641 [Rosa chinensis]
MHDCRISIGGLEQCELLLLESGLGAWLLKLVVICRCESTCGLVAVLLFCTIAVLVLDICYIGIHESEFSCNVALYG